MVMEWMATITGDHVGYPRFQDLGDFSPKKEKSLGEQNFAPLSVSNLDFCFEPSGYINLFTACLSLWYTSQPVQHYKFRTKL